MALHGVYINYYPLAEPTLGQDDHGEEFPGGVFDPCAAWVRVWPDGRVRLVNKGGFLRMISIPKIGFFLENQHLIT